MAKKLKVALEVGPKEKRVVAVALDWPGLERGGKTAEEAVERLRSYLPRYAPVAQIAGMEAAFAALRGVTVAEQYAGVGSTDFWGISFAFSGNDGGKVTADELSRELGLMRACWTYFDDVRRRVSADMQRGPRGGGRDRDTIVRHVLYTEQDWAKKLGLRYADGPLVTDDNGLKAFRDDYCATIREFHATGKTARKWPLRYLIRHTAYHTMDHAWEMEDKDLTTTVV